MSWTDEQKQELLRYLPEGKFIGETFVWENLVWTLLPYRTPFNVYQDIMAHVNTPVEAPQSLSKREQFAMAAMQGLCHTIDPHGGEIGHYLKTALARNCIVLADALIAALDEKGGEK